MVSVSKKDVAYIAMVLPMLICGSVVVLVINNDEQNASIPNPWIPTSFDGTNYLFNSVTHQQYQAIPLAYSFSNQSEKSGFDVTYSGCFQIQTSLTVWSSLGTTITFSCNSALYPFTQILNTTSYSNSGLTIHWGDSVTVYWGYIDDTEICLMPPYGCHTGVFLDGQMNSITTSVVYSYPNV